MSSVLLVVLLVSSADSTVGLLIQSPITCFLKHLAVCVFTGCQQVSSVQAPWTQMLADPWPLTPWTVESCFSSDKDLIIHWPSIPKLIMLEIMLVWKHSIQSNAEPGASWTCCSAFAVFLNLGNYFVVTIDRNNGRIAMKTMKRPPVYVSRWSKHHLRGCSTQTRVHEHWIFAVIHLDDHFKIR